MAKIIELEDSENASNSPFLDLIWSIVATIIQILTIPLAILRELFHMKQVHATHRRVEPEQMLILRRNGNWINNNYDDNGWPHGLRHASCGNVRSVWNVTNLLKLKFQQVYWNISPQTPSASTPVSHVAELNLSHAPNRATYAPSSNYERIMAKLTWLQDSGEFDMFDQLSSALVGYYRDKSRDITVAVLIEQSRCMLYRNLLARAKSLARRALKMSTGTTSPGMYIARACLVISACYRQKGKLGKAKEFLDKAWQNLANTGYYNDWALYYDAYGSYYNGLSDIAANLGKNVLENAKECFFKQLEFAESETRKKREKQRFNALLKMARTFLDANTSFGQQRQIAADDVAQASVYLDKIESESYEAVGRGLQVQFQVIRVKQYFRQQRFEEAKALLEECIDLTSGEGYERDRELMLDGLKMLTLKAEEQKSQISSKESANDTFGSTSQEGDSRLESFDSANDSTKIFDSELSDSC